MEFEVSTDPSMRAKRILVVDDEEVVRTVIRSALDRPGFYVVEASDGEEAIQLLLSEPFDMLITDKNLPGITGLDVIRQAKAADELIGTLLVTAYASRESAEEAMVIGVDDYLTKPFDMAELLEKVDQALDRRQKRIGLRQPDAREVTRRRVLVCDPDPESKSYLLEAVSRLGHRPSSVDSLSKVLEALRQKTFDALICDLGMLNKDNASACFLRSALIMTPDVRFVAVAARRGLEDAIDAIHRGAGKVIYRPLVSTAEVAGRLREFLGGVE